MNDYGKTTRDLISNIKTLLKLNSSDTKVSNRMIYEALCNSRNFIFNEESKMGNFRRFDDFKKPLTVNLIPYKNDSDDFNIVQQNNDFYVSDIYLPERISSRRNLMVDVYTVSYKKLDYVTFKEFLNRLNRIKYLPVNSSTVFTISENQIIVPYNYGKLIVKGIFTESLFDSFSCECVLDKPFVYFDYSYDKLIEKTLELLMNTSLKIPTDNNVNKRPNQ